MEDSRPHNILIVDDEKNIISALKRLLRNENYNILSANSGQEGLDILKSSTVNLIISDQRMPGMSGTEFLSKAMSENADIIRIILSGYTDIDSIAEAINRGHIYKFILKPWNDSSLVLEIRQALDQYDLVEANRKLHKTVLEQNDRLRIMNENLEAMVAERTRALEIKNHALELSQSVLDNLAVPVTGIDPDGMIALMNKAAYNLEIKSRHFAVGRNISEYFDEDVAKKISASLKSIDSAQTCCPFDKESGHIIVITPMSGRFAGCGAVITFHVPDRVIPFSKQGA